MAEQEYKDFLLDITNKVDGLILNPSWKTHFREQVETAFEQDERKDVSIHLLADYLSRLIVNPSSISDKLLPPLSDKEKLMIDYFLLAVIHDFGLLDPDSQASQRIYFDCDVHCNYERYEAVSAEWEFIKDYHDYHPAFSGQFRVYIMQSLEHIKADLDKQQKTPPSGGNARKAKKPKDRTPLEGEWSDPMTKSAMMSRVGIDGYKKFNTFAKQHGLHKAGNRQLWQIRLDGMDKTTRQKLEKA